MNKKKQREYSPNIYSHGQVIFIDVLLVILSIYILHGTLNDTQTVALKLPINSPKTDAISPKTDKLFVHKNGNIRFNETSVDLINLKKLLIATKKPIALTIQNDARWDKISNIIFLLGESGRKVTITYERK